MSRKKKVFGICHLCGEFKELTKEHIPPKMAFNNEKLIGLAQNQYLNAINNKPYKYTFAQNGFSINSLCASCNNNTGAWYANHYIDLCKSIAYYLQSMSKEEQHLIIHNEKVQFGYVIKQILCMFVSFLDFSTVHELGLDEYLLNKDNFKIDTSKFKLYCYINNKFPFFESTGKMSAITLTDEFVFCSIKTYPLCFILNLNPRKEMPIWKDMLDLEELIKIGNKTISLELGLPIIDEYAPLLKMDKFFKNRKI